jgi:hypothetical protein
VSEHSSLAVQKLATAPQRVMQFIASFALMLGVLGLLRTGLGGVDDADGPNLFVFPTHTLTALLHLVVGVLGIAAATAEGRARTAGLGFAALFTTWLAMCLALDGDPSVVVSRDDGLLAVTGAFALASLIAALAPARRVAAVADAALAEDPQGAVRRPGA